MLFLSSRRQKRALSSPLLTHYSKELIDSQFDLLHVTSAWNWEAELRATCMGMTTCSVTQVLVLRRDPRLCLASCFAVAILKFSKTFAQRAMHFPFALGPAKYMASPGRDEEKTVRKLEAARVMM